MQKRSLKVNAFLNVVKQAVNVIFPFLLYPYITRVLGKDNFGRYSFAYSIVEYAMLIAALGIPTYGTREGAQVRENKTKIRNFAAEMFGISLIALAVSVSALLIITWAVPNFRKESALVLILMINVAAYGVSRDYLFDVYEDYLAISVRYILIKLAALLLIFAFVRDTGDLISYTLIMAATEAGGYVLSLIYSRRYVPVGVRFGNSLKKHMKPILYLFMTTVAVRIYIQSDITILGFFVPDGDVGVYSLAARLYSVIKGILNAMIFVCIPRIAAYLGEGERYKYNYLLNKMKQLLPALLFPCVVGAFCLSESILIVFGGREFAAGSSALKLLCTALAFAVFGCFYAQGILIPNRKEKKYFIFTTVSAGTNIILNIIIIPFWGIVGAAVTTLIAEIMICVSCAIVGEKLYVPEKRVKDYAGVIVGCVVIGVICYLCLFFIASVGLQIVIAVLASVIAYSLILCAFRHPAAQEGIKVLKGIGRKLKR